MSLPLIAIVRGGFTGEAVISMQSARTFYEAVDTSRYTPLYLTVERSTWACTDAAGNTFPFDRAAFTVDRGQGAERFAGALIAIHGTPGEDGKLQGYLDMLEVPYQTGGVLNMALTMSKFSTTGLLRQLGFPVAKSILLRKGMADSEARIAQEVGFPCFIKPDTSGSSLGISKAKSPADLPEALAKAFAEDAAVLVEAGVQGRELTCGVIRLNGKAQALPVCEIRTSREFFDYEAKYHAADTQELVPAPIPDAVARMIQERSVAIYEAFGCNGMVRVDNFWLNPEQGGSDVVTIELNTTPGFSAASIFPKMLNASGIGVPAAVNGLIAGLLAKV